MQNYCSSSVLQTNPTLYTSKEDKKNHSRGISIVKSIAEKYGGDVVISEKNNEFIVSVILDNRIFTKTHYFYLIKIKYSKKCYPFFKALCQESGMQIQNNQLTHKIAIK